MSREIKFRVFHKIKKSILEVGWISFQEKTMGFGDGSCWRFNDEVVLMQSTGLKDKNGVEIYEGDILKIQTREVSPFIGYIFYDDKKSGFQFYDLTDKKSYTIYKVDKKSFEVIGNVYENLDLIIPAKD